MTDTTRSQELPRVLVLAADEITADYSTGITVANLFKDWPRDRGHIALQEHGGTTAFRNIKIRVIEK